jgi:predicted  nucleic acid-binding Zn-ribbon protein
MTTMTTQPLDTIVALQQALRRLAEGEARLSGIPDWMKELHAEHAGRRGEISALEAQAETAAQERRASERQIEDAQEKLKHYQQQIGLVRTQREYGALLQEIDGVKASVKGFEEQALGALERAEQTQGQLGEAREAFRELDERYAAELAKWEAEKPAVSADVERVRVTVADLRSQVPAPLLSRFTRLFERYRGAALAPIRKLGRAGVQESWSCGACNYRVRPQVVVEIRTQGALIECDSCKRILFVEETI